MLVLNFSSHRYPLWWLFSQISVVASWYNAWHLSHRPIYDTGSRKRWCYRCSKQLRNSNWRRLKKIFSLFLGLGLLGMEYCNYCSDIFSKNDGFLSALFKANCLNKLNLAYKKSETNLRIQNLLINNFLSFNKNSFIFFI